MSVKSMTFRSRFFAAILFWKSRTRSISVFSGSRQTRACSAASSSGVAKNLSAIPFTLFFTSARREEASSLFAGLTLSSFFEESRPKFTAGSHCANFSKVWQEHSRSICSISLSTSSPYIYGPSGS